MMDKALSKQIKWLQTWKTSEGAYNGFVVHRHDLKRMFKIHDTPWSQGPIIVGYINLYEHTRDPQWLNEAIAAADLQCKRISVTGEYIYAGYEDDRFSSLVHNSLANCALLDLSKTLINDGRDAAKYINVVKKNIDEYLIKELWDEEFGAFRFSRIDYYSPDKTRYVVNMNSLAVESLIKLSNLINEEKYQEYAIKIGEWMLTEQIISDDIENGGISYSHVQPRVLISIYTALAMRGLDDLYLLTNDPRYLEMMKAASTHLMSLVDSETNLFCHKIEDGKLFKYPEFISGAGIILKALNDTEKLTGENYDYCPILDAVLENQLPNGGFKNFVGYNSTDNNRINGDEKVEVWEDTVPTIGWNAHIFEFLSRKFQGQIPENSMENNKIFNNRYGYCETKNWVMIISLTNINSSILYLTWKRLPISIVYLSKKQYRKILGYMARLYRKFIRSKK